MIEAVIERCAGIDVGKKFLVVCVMSGSLEAEPKTEIRKFGTIVAELEHLRDWLIQEGCSHAVMESTSSYWKPVFNILEDSVIPERAIRELRDLTRRRRQLVGERARERNRIQKILEDANVKLGDVLSDVLGLSGRLMIDALLEGLLQVEEIAQLAQRKAKQKIPDLIAALQRNRLTDHHRFLLRHALRHLDFLAEEIEALNIEIRSRLTTEQFRRCNPFLGFKKKLPLRFSPKLVRIWRSSHPTPIWHPGPAFAPAITKALGYARPAAPIAAITGSAVF
jgi:transposase